YRWRRAQRAAALPEKTAGGPNAERSEGFVPKRTRTSLDGRICNRDGGAMNQESHSRRGDPNGIRKGLARHHHAGAGPQPRPVGFALGAPPGVIVRKKTRRRTLGSTEAGPCHQVRPTASVREPATRRRLVARCEGRVRTRRHPVLSAPPSNVGVVIGTICT